MNTLKLPFVILSIIKCWLKVDYLSDHFVDFDFFISHTTPLDVAGYPKPPRRVKILGEELGYSEVIRFAFHAVINY